MRYEIVRQAALEAQGLGSSDIVKTAALLRKIRNWLKYITNTQFRRKVKDLQADSAAVRVLAQELDRELTALEGAVGDADVYAYDSALERVKSLILELAKELKELNRGVKETEELPPEPAPAPAHAIPQPAEERKENISVPIPALPVEPQQPLGEKVVYTREDMNRPEFLPTIRGKISDDHDIPFNKERTLKMPIKASRWFMQVKKLTPNHIMIRRGAATVIAKAMVQALGTHGIDPNELKHFKDGKFSDQFYEGLRSRILEAGVIRYYYPRKPAEKPADPSSAKAGNEYVQVGQMTMEIGVSGVEIPDTDPKIKLDMTLTAVDMTAGLRPSEYITLVRGTNVRVVSPPGGESHRQRPVGAKPPELAKPLPPEKSGPELTEISQDDEASENNAYEKKAIRSGSRIKKLVAIAQEKQNIHLWARDILIQAFREVMSREPSAAELQGAQAVAWGESNYGRGWVKGTDSRAKASNNWGAIQAGKPNNGVCPAGTFLYEDTHPTKSGTNVKYQICFRAYGTPLEGAKDLIKTLYGSKRKGNADESRGVGLLNATRDGSVEGFSTSMYDTGYYEGWGKNREERIANHVKYMNRHLKTISKATGEPIAFGSPGPDRGEGLPGTDTPGLKHELDRSTQYIAQSVATDPEGAMAVKEYQTLLPLLLQSSMGPIEGIVRKAIEKRVLPTSRVLLTINGNKAIYAAAAEYARILECALREEIGAKTATYSDGEKIEIESLVVGEESAVVKAVKATADAISDVFENNTSKLGGIKITASVVAGACPKYELLTLDAAEKNHRLFSLAMSV